MGEDGGCFFTKDMLVIKPTKKSPLVVILVALALVTLSGVYMCLVCLKQYRILVQPNVMKIERIGQPCRAPDISPSEVPYVHYPEPTTYSRNECACTPVRYFAILLMQRSGSGWFETLLNSHINISSNGEIFSVKERRSNISSITSSLDKVYNLDWFSSASKNECTSAVGFKWMLNQVRTIITSEEAHIEGTHTRGLGADGHVPDGPARRTRTLGAEGFTRRTSRRLNERDVNA